MSVYPQSAEKYADAAESAVRYEFEDAEFTGTVKKESDAAASGGAVLYMTEDGDITVTVTVDSEGMYDTDYISCMIS